jgi:hypothetical protein
VQVVRKFGSDRFLRVAFDAYSGPVRQLKETYRKVFASGIHLGGRHYEMLAWSASQLREGKCYFFASSGDDITDGITAEYVRYATPRARLSLSLRRLSPSRLVSCGDCDLGSRMAWRLQRAAKLGKVRSADGAGLQ